ncbi:MAG: hypothetical protein IAE82_06505 [Opitutaceae bacterium]|nr:hypothetical protein [Opitutaceae bacterium]
MKTIIRPSRPEKAQFSCDVTGDALPDGPATTIEIHCGYGAPYDGDTFVIDLSMTAAEVVVPLLRALLLGGGPLAPHLTHSLLPARRPEREPWISRRERTRLLRALEKLVRHRVISESLAKKQRTGPVSRRGAALPAEHGRPGASAALSISGTRRKKKHTGQRTRFLSPEFERLMKRKPGRDVLDDLNAVRGKGQEPGAHAHKSQRGSIAPAVKELSSEQRQRS